MERLTIRTNEASISFECERVGDIVRRLAAIEDILGEEYDLERVRELVEADRDGRCIISPCKTGDTVYFKTFTNNARKCLGICPHVVTAIKAHAEVKGEFHNVELPLSQFGDTWDLREEALKAREQDG